MENNHPIEELNENLKQYLNTRYEIMVLKAADQVSGIGSIASAASILGVLLLLFLLFGSVAAGFYLSELAGSYGLGFLILAGIFLFLFFFIYFLRKKLIIEPIRNKLIREMFNNK